MVKSEMYCTIMKEELRNVQGSRGHLASAVDAELAADARGK